MRLKRAIRFLGIMIAALSFGTALAIGNEAPGWFKAGSNPADFDMGVDCTVAFNGYCSGFIKSIKPEPQGFGTLMQQFDAAQLRGKRIRLSAYVKAEKVDGWAGVWFRVDKAEKSIAFDNMQSRPIKGTQNWTQCSVVLDVDSTAEKIAFGILMNGPGAVWIDEVRFTPVGNDVPVTDMMKAGTPGSPTEPRNLDFEEK